MLHRVASEQNDQRNEVPDAFVLLLHYFDHLAVKCCGLSLLVIESIVFLTGTKD